MPNNSNRVLEYVREKDPGLKDVSDANLTAYIKDRFPDLYSEMAPFKQKSVAQTARKHLADLGTEKSKEIDEQTKSKEKQLKFAQEVVKTAPLAMAAPFTGGLSVLPALGVVGGAAIVGGGVEHAMRAIGGDRESGKKIAKDLAWDAAWAMAGEGTGRLLSVAAKALVPKMVERAASMTEGGRQALRKMLLDTNANLNKAIKPNTIVDVGKTVDSTINNIAKLKSIPRHESSEPFKEFVTSLAQARKQPLGNLVEIHDGLEKFAKSGVLKDVREQSIVESFSSGLKSDIEKSFKAQPELAKNLWANLKDLRHTDAGNEAATDLIGNATHSITRSLINRAAFGTFLGGGLGYQRSRSIGGTIKGAAIGAAGVTLAPKAIGGLATLILQQVAAHPQAAKQLKTAVDFVLAGESDQPAKVALREFGMDMTLGEDIERTVRTKAGALALRAAVVAGARDTVRAFLSSGQESKE